jgi:hypothetical protein
MTLTKTIAINAIALQFAAEITSNGLVL